MPPKIRIPVIVVLLCASISLSLDWWSASIRSRVLQGALSRLDFGVIYYGARTAIHHMDPYNSNAVLNEFNLDGGKFPPAPRDRKVIETVVEFCIYPPSALLLAVPFSVLPFTVAEHVWTLIMAGLFVLTALAVWDLGGAKAPVLWGCLASLVLLNCLVLFSVGNVAGIVVNLCILSAWCFLKGRYEVLGVLMLASALAIKPHDSGFLWLYFLLAGGRMRKRAFQSVAIASAIGLISAIWIAPMSPHWIQEIKGNLEILSARGGAADPGPEGLPGHTNAPVIDMQGVMAIFKDDPHFYDPASYLISGIPILIWAFFVVKKKHSPQGALFALASIVPLSLLPAYHRPYDAKLLMLTIPACAVLWETQRLRRVAALVLTSAAIFITADFPLWILTSYTNNLPRPTTLNGKVVAVLVTHPIPLILLGVGCFYLWIFATYEAPPRGALWTEEAHNEREFATAV